MPKGIPNRKNDKLIDSVVRATPRQEVERIAEITQKSNAYEDAVATEALKAYAVPPPPPAPEPPNPVVLALQEQILELVNRRGVFQSALLDSTKAMREIAAQVEYNRERLQQAEGEVQYRFGLIAQLQGKPAMQGWASPAAFPNATQPNPITDYGYLQQERPTPTPFDLSRAPQSGMGSIPAQRPQMEGVVGEVRQESAEDMRRAM